MDSGWVTASAGAGKTNIIVNRVIKLLLLGVKIDKILLVTLTNNASKELDCRIRQKIKFLLNLDNDEFCIFLKKNLNYNCNSDIIFLKNRLKNAISEENYSKTIHAHCFQSIKKFAKFFSIDLSDLHIEQDFRITSIIKEAVNDVLFSHHIMEDEDFLSFVYDIGFTKVISLVTELVRSHRRVYSFSDENKLNNAIISECIQNGDLIKCFDVKDIFLNSNISVDGLASSTCKIVSAINDFFCSDFSDLDIQKYVSIFIAKNGERKALRFNKDVCSNLRQSILDEQDRIFSIMMKINSYVMSSDTIKIVSIAIIVSNTLNCDKIIGFKELIDIYINMLMDPEIGKSIAYDFFSQYDHFIIDEAQDLTLEQWKIVCLLTENFFVDGKSFFCVGDPKQSIYGFLGVNADLFFYYKKIITKLVTDGGKIFQETDLNISYRSDIEIINFINYIFDGKNIGCDVKTHFSASDKCGKVSIIKAFDVCSYLMNYQDAKIVCHKDIAKSLTNKIKKCQEEGCDLEDIMILIRKRSELIDVITDEFFDCEINFNYDSQNYKNLFNKICLIVDIARFILFEDLNSAVGVASIFNDRISVLNSLEDLSDDNKFNKVKTYCSNSKKAFLISEKYSFCDSFKKLFVEIFLNLIDVPILAKTELLFFEFCDFAIKGGVFNILDFVVWFDRYGRDAINYIDFDCSDNAGVKIMTIHSAKGLQSDIVFVLDDGDYPKIEVNKFFYSDYEEKKLPFFARGKQFMNEKINSLIEADRKNLDYEYKRLLYVALTRAKKKLFFIGMKKKNFKNCWYNFVYESLGEKFENYLIAQ